MECHNSKIELFKMILKRNELCRLANNARMKYDYWVDWAKRSKDSQLKELCYLRNSTVCLESLKLIDDAIVLRKKNINFMDRSPEFIKNKLLKYAAANAKVYAFTKRTHKRRMELQKIFNTLQNKDCGNIIRYIRVNSNI